MSNRKNNTNKNMILVEAGRFEMGKKSNKHLVAVTKDFCICKYPVTTIEYAEFCKEDENKNNPDELDRMINRNIPAVNISWYDAIEYCNWLTRKEGEFEEVYVINKNLKDIRNNSSIDRLKWTVTCNFDKKGYRLPTEAEWEFAAKGGNMSQNLIYSGSNSIDEVAWYIANSNNILHPVGEKLHNELGIHDMSGNAFEWCWNWIGNNKSADYYHNPRRANTGSDRVGRGGNWNGDGKRCEVDRRYGHTPSQRYSIIGFRVVRTC